ncbi:MAG: alpha/beta fold hydrolase [Gammaproteobacteria bacterium]|nr:alpha/beta fold hydrolase [Gammaproteobacteria bacterium]
MEHASAVNIQSSKQVSINVVSRGSGKPIIFMHGTAASARRWGKVADAFVADRQVIEYDRRGRGKSTDADLYSLQNEIEDLHSILNHFGKGKAVDLVAHSYGALIALATLTKHSNSIDHLILYEAPLSVTGQCEFIDIADVDEMEKILGHGGNEAATEFFLRRFPRVSEKEITELKKSSIWQERVAAASTLGRELRAAFEYRIVEKGLGELSLPCLILLGGASPEPFQISAQYLHSLMPTSKLEVLTGERHRAMDTRPAVLVEVIEKFLQN